jgi:RNA polymerase sigma factor (sigma-70 family)
MEKALSIEPMAADQNKRIAETIEQNQARLRNFIRSRVSNDAEVEDILQEVFYELVVAYRTMQPLEQAGAWLFRVARNRIIDLFRRKKPAASISDPVAGSDPAAGSDRAAAGSGDGEALLLRELLPSPDAGPEAAYANGVLLDELEAALNELPAEQREVFIAHEIEGKSFKEIAAESGTSVNTLLSRKHYAVLHLRERLAAIYDEFTGG